MAAKAASVLFKQSIKNFEYRTIKTLKHEKDFTYCFHFCDGNNWEHTSGTE
jgi:hypothetical protein